MSIPSRWFTRTALGGALLLGACTDQGVSPVEPLTPLATAPVLRSVGITSTGQEQIYLSDTREGGGGDGSVLYQVELDDGAGVANLTALVDLNVSPYNGLFDRAHIAATPDGETVYLINRDPVASAGGNPVGTFDASSGTFSLAGVIPGMVSCSGKGVVLTAFSPDGELYVANECNSVLYRIALPSLTVAQQWTVYQAGTSTRLELTGGDIGFDADGVLYAWSNEGGTQGLHRIELQAADAEATALAKQPGRFVTGLAVRAAGTGHMLGSSRTEDAVVAFDRTSGAPAGSFPMRLGGSPYDHTFGDMTVGLLRPPPPPPEPELEITKSATKTKVDAGQPIAFSITVRNIGEGDASDVEIHDVLPSGDGLDWTISPAVAGCTISGSPQTLSCDFETLASGATVTVSVASPTTLASCGEYTNEAQVSSKEISAIPSNEVSVKVACKPGDPKLKVTKVADEAKVTEGDQIGFTITVTNEGSGVAKDVSLLDILPLGWGLEWKLETPVAGCSIKEIIVKVLTCSFGDLPAGETRTLHLVSPTNHKSKGIYLNLVKVWADNHGHVVAGDKVVVVEDSSKPEITGCSVSYWKSNPWNWSHYKPSHKFKDVFGVSLVSSKLTLYDALKLRGDGKDALAREAVAAMLNAKSSGVAYGKTPAEIIEIVRHAVRYRKYDQAAKQLKELNDLKCPLK